MSSVVLGRHLTLETVEVEVFASVDGQGAPTYDTPADIDVRVLRQDKFVTVADGSKIKTELTLWVPGSETPQPGHRDRITYESETFIVVEIKDVKDGAATIVHRRARCRRE